MSPMTLDSAPYTIVSHPVLLHKLTQLRNVNTASADFRRLVKEISGILGVEASRSLALKDVPGVRGPAPTPRARLSLMVPSHSQLESPIAPFTGQAIAHRIGISPILRAGIGMTDCESPRCPLPLGAG